MATEGIHTSGATATERERAVSQAKVQSAVVVSKVPTAHFYLPSDAIAVAMHGNVVDMAPVTMPLSLGS